MRIVPALPMADWNEKQWQDLVIGSKANPGVARTLGYRCYHTLRSKGSEAGWPDWALVRPGRFVLLELKTEAKTSKCTTAQREWIAALHAASVEVYVARPRHLDALAWVLQQRVRPMQGPHLDELLRELRTEALE